MVDQPKRRGRGPWVHLLGTVPDRVIAEQSGVSTSTVCTWRKALGIPPCRKHVGRNATHPEWYALLGTMPDGDIAQAAGVTRQAVHAARTRLGAPRVDAAEVKRAGWVALVADRLGVVPDGDLAAEVGACRSAIYLERHRRGIPPAPRPHRPPREGSQFASILAVLRAAPEPLDSRTILEAVGVKCAGENGHSTYLFRTGRLRGLRKRGLVAQVGRDLWTVPCGVSAPETKPPTG